MASEIRVTNIKANDGTSSLTVANSSGNVSVGGTLTSAGAITASGGIANAGTVTAGTLGSSVVFPSGHILQSVFSPTRTADGNAKTTLGGDGSVVCTLDGQITISSGNGVLIYVQATVYVDRASADVGYIAYIKEGLLASGTNLSSTYERDSITDGNWWNTTTIWAYDSSPASTTPDYCFALTRATSGANDVRLNTTDATSLKTFLFEVKQ
jgi:hypothetical protein